MQCLRRHSGLDGSTNVHELHSVVKPRQRIVRNVGARGRGAINPSSPHSRSERLRANSLPGRQPAVALKRAPNLRSLRYLFPFVVLAYAIVLAPLIDAGLRNYLVLFAAALGGLCIIIYELPLQRQVWWVTGLALYMVASVSLAGNLGDLWSVGLTLLYITGYLAAGGLLSIARDKRQVVERVLRWVIYAFAAISVLQMLTSLVGLPVPNLIQSKGLWSYNSLAMEPSQVGRVVGITFLAFLIVRARPDEPEPVKSLLTTNRWPWCAFLATMLLSGSALAFAAIIAALVLSRSFGVAVVWSLSALALVPIMIAVDFAPLQRSLLLLTNFSFANPYAMMEVEGSGASRILPALIYLGEASVGDVGFWLGYGSEGISRFFLARIPGFGDIVAAGFLPGFAVIYGVVGFSLFMWTFLFRFIGRETLPIIIFWLVFFSTSAVNTQVIWYGLILIWAVHLVRAGADDARTFSR